VAEETTCAVCGEPGDQTEFSICNSCGEPFHLNQRNDTPGKDCGMVWINEQFLALEFACQRCLDGDAAPPQRPAPRVLRPRTAKRRYRRRA
jgi:hypothetical protein